MYHLGHVGIDERQDVACLSEDQDSPAFLQNPQHSLQQTSPYLHLLGPGLRQKSKMQPLPGFVRIPQDSLQQFVPRLQMDGPHWDSPGPRRGGFMGEVERLIGTQGLALVTMHSC